jgi:hypothetical protein
MWRGPSKESKKQRHDKGRDRSRSVRTVAWKSQKAAWDMQIGASRWTVGGDEAFGIWRGARQSVHGLSTDAASRRQL